MTWVSQMRALVSFPDNCGTNHGWADCSWSTETADPGLLPVSFLVYLYFFSFVIRYYLFCVSNIHDSKRGTSSFRYINIYWGTPSFASINMDLVRRWDKLSFQDLNSCCKGDNTSWNMIFLIFSYVIFFDLLIWSSE